MTCMDALCLASVIFDFSAGPSIRLRIPEKLDGHSTRSWASNPRHRGHLFHELGQVTDAFMGSSLPNLVKRFRDAHLSAHAFSGQGEAVGVVNQAVEDGVGEDWVADGLVPLVDWQLACDDGGAAALPVLENFQEITAFGGGQHRQAPVVQDQDLSALDGFQNAGEPTVASGDCQCLEEPGNAVIHDPAVIAARLVAERTGNPTFFEPGRARDQ